MKRGALLAGILLLGLMLNATTRADTPATANDPYIELITNRNVFGLKPIPPPPSSEPPPQPPLGVKLIGLAEVGGKNLAVLSITDPTKPPSPTNITTFVRGVGDREKDIEVLAIDLKSRTVKVKNRESVSDIQIEEPKVTGSPGPLVAGGALPTINLPPGFQRSAVPVAMPTLGAPGGGMAIPAPPPAVATPLSSPTSPLAVPALGGAAVSATPVPAVMTTVTPLPSRPVRTTETPPIPLQQQLLQVEQQRQAAASAGLPPPPALPTPPTLQSLGR